MQSFSTMTMRANDLLSNDICSKFVELESQIQNFQRLIKRFKTNFSKDLAAILPKIRGEGAEEVVLTGLIESVRASPFNAKDMDSYIKGKRKETKQLIQYLKNMHKESKIVHLLPSRDGDLGTLTSDFDIKHLVCFAFNVVVSDSTAYTDALEDFLATGKKYAKSTSVKEWFDNSAISAELRSKSSKFLDFVRTNSCAEAFRFAVTDMNEETGTSGPAIILYTDGSGEDYEPPGKPGTPSATTVDTSCVNLVWKKTETGAESIASYKIWFQEGKEEKENGSSKSTAESSPGKVVEFHCTPTAETKYCIDNLSPGTRYEFWVQAVSDIKVFSANSEKCCGSTKPLPRPADEILKLSSLIEHGPPQVYKLPLHPLSENKAKGFCKYSIGKSNSNLEKVLILIGATGAGKSTLINGLVNYLMGVKFEDTFRFEVITDEESGSQAHSQTKTITAYKFYFSILNFNLTVIDTPGLGDTGGIERDKHIAKQIITFFEGQIGGGIDVLHVIGLVTQASIPRLTLSRKYIIDTILLNFGKDLVNSIFLLATFADGTEPHVLDAIKAAKIPFQQCFKFNNSALFSRIDTDGSHFNSMFWKIGSSSFDNFFVSFSRAEMKSLTLTREVLKERQQLETLILEIQQVKLGLNIIGASLLKKSSTESVKQRVEHLQSEKQRRLEALLIKAYSLIKQIQESNMRLSEIAMKPNLLTETDNLELLIASEEQEKEHGWKERIKQYRVLLKEAAVLKSVSNMEIKDRHDQEMQSMWSSFKQVWSIFDD